MHDIRCVNIASNTIRVTYKRNIINGYAYLIFNYVRNSVEYL